MERYSIHLLWRCYLLTTQNKIKSLGSINFKFFAKIFSVRNVVVPFLCEYFFDLLHGTDHFAHHFLFSFHALSTHLQICTIPRNFVVPDMERKQQALVSRETMGVIACLCTGGFQALFSMIFKISIKALHAPLSRVVTQSSRRNYRLCWNLIKNVKWHLFSLR